MGDGSGTLTAASECSTATLADENNRPTPLAQSLSSDDKSKNLTANGKKALQYRIYWLERKLAHQKESKQRIDNERRIAKMAPSMTKEMMHLNNEFQRANEESVHLHKLTHEVNDESLRMNLRLQQVCQVADKQVEESDRINSEALRLNAASRKINRESLRTTRISRRVNRHAQKAIVDGASIAAESRQLNECLQTLQGQIEHQIDTTESLNSQTNANLAASAKTDADLLKTRSESDKINQSSLQINQQLLESNSQFDQLTQDSCRINENSIEIQQSLRETSAQCQEAIEQVEKAEKSLIETNQSGQRMLQAAESTHQRGKAINEGSEQLQEKLQDSFTLLQQESEQAWQNLHTHALESLNGTQAEAHNITDELSNSLCQSEEINQRSLQINESLLQTNQQFDQLNQQSCRINQDSLQSQQTAKEANQQSLAAIEKVVAAAKRADKLAEVSQQNQQVAESINADSQSINVVSKQLQNNLQEAVAKMETDSDEALQGVKRDTALMLQQVATDAEQTGAECRQATQESKRVVAASDEMNQVAQQNMACSQEIIQQSLQIQEEFEQAIHKSAQTLETTAVINQKSESILDESKRINRSSENVNEKSEQINERSLELQQECLRTQELSQDINDHSLQLHQESERRNDRFEQLNREHEQWILDISMLDKKMTELAESSKEQIEIQRQTEHNSRAINEESNQINSHSKQLNRQTEDVIVKARQLNDVSEGVNRESQSVKLGLARLTEELEIARLDCAQTAETARETINSSEKIMTDSIDLNTHLKATVAAFDSLRSEAESNSSRIKELCQESEATILDSRLINEESKKTSEESRLINDEFLRSLEAANRTSSETRQSIQKVLDRNTYLQDNVASKDVVKDGFESLRAEIGAYQSRLDDCEDNLLTQQRAFESRQSSLAVYDANVEEYRRKLDGYESDLSATQARQNELHTESNGYQTKLGGYQTKLESYLTKLDVYQIRLDGCEIKMQDYTAKMDEYGEFLYTQSEKSVEYDRGLAAVEEKSTAQTAKLLEMLNSQAEQIASYEADRGKSESKLTSGERKIQILDTLLKEYERKFKEYDKKLTEQVSQGDEISHRIDRYEQNEMHRTDAEKEAQQALEEAQQGRQESLQFARKFKQALEDALTTNRELQKSIEDTRTTNAHIIQANDTLQGTNRQADVDHRQQLGLIKNFEQSLHNYSYQEGNYHQLIEDLRQREEESQKALQQVQTTMKDSNRIIRESQKTIKQLQVEKSRNETDSQAAWWQKPKSSVLSALLIAVLLPATYIGNQVLDTKTQLAASQQQQFTNVRDNYITRALDSRRTLYQRRKDLVFLDNFLKDKDLHDWVIIELNQVNSSISAEQADYQPSSAGGYPVLITDITPTGVHSKSTMNSLGQFIWPVNYGKIDPRTIKYQPHRQGISILAELGEPIVAVNDGKVIYSDNQIRGYGNVIVIQHNDELVSVYANNQLNYVNEGDQVRKGQLIADVGQLFNSNSPGLYFEMRFNGQAEDPFNYLAKKNSKDSS